MGQKVKIFLQTFGMGVLRVYSCHNWDVTWTEEHQLFWETKTNKILPTYKFTAFSRGYLVAKDITPFSCFKKI